MLKTNFHQLSDTTDEPAVEYLVRRGGQSIFAIVPAGAVRFVSGDEVTLLIDPVGIAVLPE